MAEASKCTDGEKRDGNRHVLAMYGQTKRVWTDEERHTTKDKEKKREHTRAT